MEINMGREYIDGKVVGIEDFARDCNLEILWSEKGYKLPLSTVSVNRPGLVLSGFDDYFAGKRLQVMGNAEMYFLYKMDTEACDKALRALFKHKIPCLIISRHLQPTEHMIDIAKEYNCPILRSDEITSNVVNDLVNYLNDQLAPETTVHGELLDVDGIGVLITGNSGIGKSETALELIQRGHRLVTDDVVEIRKISDTELIGRSSEIIRNLIELRGIGVIDVRQLFGMRAIKVESQLDLVVNFEQWDQTKFYDRLGIEDHFTDILDVQVPILTVPVRPGRALASIVEVAAMNNRYRYYGHNAAAELAARVDAVAEGKHLDFGQDYPVEPKRDSK